MAEPARYRADPVTTHRAWHAEGPMWDSRTGTLVYVDQFDGLVNVASWDPVAGALGIGRTLKVGHPVGAVVPTDQASGWMTAARHGFVWLGDDGSTVLLGQPAEADDTPTRMNDGKCDPWGRFWAGTITGSKTIPGAALYRLGTDLTVRRMLTGVTTSNGLAWSGDRRTMFYIDSPTGRVDRFDLDADGDLVRREPAVVVDGPGVPDGMCIDDEGCLWVALWNGHADRRYSPAGTLLATVDVAAPHACGRDGSTLFITTSQHGLDAGARSRYPDSGRVFAVDLDVTAPPAAAFTP